VKLSLKFRSLRSTLHGQLRSREDETKLTRIVITSDRDACRLCSLIRLPQREGIVALLCDVAAGPSHVGPLESRTRPLRIPEASAQVHGPTFLFYVMESGQGLFEQSIMLLRPKIDGTFFVCTIRKRRFY
jgi:hypothetical protein